MKKILFTGFEPFGGERINPSWEAVRLLPDEINGATIVKAQVCVEYSGSETALRALIARHAPDAVICCGQAGGRSGVSIECCALNMDHAAAADNAGEVRRYTPIAPDYPAAYFTQAPVERIVADATAAGLACAPSFCAGTYVCNHIYYNLLKEIARAVIPKMGLFIHVPYIPSQTATHAAPSMELSEIAAVLKLAAEIIAPAI